MNIQVPPGDQVGSDPEEPSTSSKKGTRQKVWDRMSWFRRKSRSKDNVGDSSGSSNVISPRVSANSEDPGSSLDGADIDFSRETSTSSCSPVNSPSLLGSASSSESELFTSQIDRQLSKQPRMYPNSEIVEQSCLRPSIARALFLQLESWMSKKNQAGTSNSKLNQKYTWPKKKRPCSSIVEGDGDLEASMTRAMSMPGGMLGQSKCHCAACCSCTHRERLEGRCPAYIKLTSSTTSLDTGLASLGLSLLYSPPQIHHDASACYDVSITPTDQGTSMTTTDLPKCNSLPTNPAQCTYKTCPSCSRYIPYVPQANNCDAAGAVPSTSTSSCHSYFCLCQMDPSGDFKDCNKYSSQETSNGTVPPTCGLPTDSQPAKAQAVSTSPRVGPSEFKERTGVIKQWFSEFNDEQKNLILKQLLSESDLPQLHMLSLEMESRLHANCPPNCHDRVSWLPQTVALYIMSFLDPVSLCQASSVCRGWAQLANEPSLWRYFCGQGKWRLSMTGEQKQFLHHMRPDGTIAWKEVFAEKYRLRNNWIKGKCNVRTFEGHHQGISCVQFDDTRIVSGSSDKTIKVWNIRTNNPWAVQTLVGHSGTVRCLHLDGNRLVSGSTDGTIKVWDLSTQQSWSSIACKVTMIGHTDTVRCLQVDEEKVISGSYDKTLKVWDMKNGVCRGTLRGHDAAVLCVQFDDSKIVSGSCDKTIKVWKFDGTCMMTLEGHHDAVTCLQFDTSRIFSGSLDCNLKFWDIHTGECVNTIDWKASEGHTGVVRCLQADSWRVVSASDDRTLKVWSLETGQRLVTLRNHTDGVTCLQFNDSIIVSGSYDKTVKLWDFSCC